MRSIFLHTLKLTWLMGMGIIFIQPTTSAVKLRDGKVYFTQPPRLVKAVTTSKSTYVWNATYYFTISIPKNSGEPLQKVTINQHEGLDRIRFDKKDSFAFEKTSSRKKNKLNIEEITNDISEEHIHSDRKKKTISLTFNPPVSPGKIITVALKPEQNPTVAGVYLFGVTAYPPGEKSHGQFLGFGRFHFYNDSFGF
ncbi:MAG: DUF2808 domain-containing protein [Cyanobacteria bacterium P01_A01_bin.84]